MKNAGLLVKESLEILAFPLCSLRLCGEKKERAMKAVRIHKTGSPDVLQYEEAPMPSLEKDGLLVQVHATALNPLDVKVRGGSRKITEPFTLGWDVSGVVVESASPDFKVGDAVYSMMEVDGEGKAYAEYIAAP